MVTDLFLPRSYSPNFRNFSSSFSPSNKWSQEVFEGVGTYLYKVNPPQNTVFLMTKCRDHPIHSVVHFWQNGILRVHTSRSKRTDAFCRQKGVEHALDYRCDSLHSVAVGISRRLYGWWTHSYPAGHRHRRRADPSHPGTKNTVEIWTLAGEGEVFGKEVVSRFRKM